MKSFNKPFCIALGYFFLLAGCSHGNSVGNQGPIAPGLPNGATLAALSGPNVISFGVNTSPCSASSSSEYQNKPCVSVTVCTPGNDSQCDTISDILLDTGSYGLRLFSSVLSNAHPTQITAGGSPLIECATFGDGTELWGGVSSADVILGGEPAARTPIQIVNASFGGGTLPSICSSPTANPSEARFNGILGIGLFKQDCGSTCVNNGGGGPAPDVYFTCPSGTCGPVYAPLADQVTNPITLLSADNNGAILELPDIPFGGVSSISGYLVLGIGTRSNNTPGSVTVFPADPNTANFTTKYNGQIYSQSFIDSGSNAYYFPSSISQCGSELAGWYCPGSLSTQTATNVGFSGTPSSSVSFYIGNLSDLLTNSSGNVFIEMGGSGGSTQFDWGLPFYIGRNIYHGYEGGTSPLGTGMYWAY